MSNPAYLWFEDEGGAPIVGGSLVNGRLGAIELKSLSHNLNIPIDGYTGRLTGTRVHDGVSCASLFSRGGTLSPFMSFKRPLPSLV